MKAAAATLLPYVEHNHEGNGLLYRSRSKNICGWWDQLVLLWTKTEQHFFSSKLQVATAQFSRFTYLKSTLFAALSGKDIGGESSDCRVLACLWFSRPKICQLSNSVCRAQMENEGLADKLRGLVSLCSHVVRQKIQIEIGVKYSYLKGPKCLREDRNIRWITHSAFFNCNSAWGGMKQTQCAQNYNYNYYISYRLCKMWTFQRLGLWLGLESQWHQI